MSSAKLNTTGLFVSLDDLVIKILQLIESANDGQINTIPFKDSWTAAKVIAHVTKYTQSTTQALSMQGNKIDRDPGERVGELKEMFLNFNIKMKSPGFILPTRDTYEKSQLIQELKQSFEDLKEEGRRVNLSEAINHRAFGDISKLELLYFVVYHTERHLYQLRNIFEIINNK